MHSLKHHNALRYYLFVHCTYRVVFVKTQIVTFGLSYTHAGQHRVLFTLCEMRMSNSDSFVSLQFQVRLSKRSVYNCFFSAYLTTNSTRRKQSPTKKVVWLINTLFMAIQNGQSLRQILSSITKSISHEIPFFATDKAFNITIVIRLWTSVTSTNTCPDKQDPRRRTLKWFYSYISSQLLVSNDRSLRKVGKGFPCFQFACCSTFLLLFLPYRPISQATYPS